MALRAYDGFVSRKAALLGVLSMLVVIAAACSASNDTPPTKICTPGNYVFCRCKDRSEGTKLCHDDGLGFDPCDGCLSGSDGDSPDDPPTEGGPDPEEDSSTPIDSSIPPEAAPGTTRPQVGQLFITEIMYDPSGNEPTDEWFEVYSTATTTVNLNGMFLKDGAGRLHVLGPTPSMDLPPKTYMLLVRNQPSSVANGLPSAKILGEYGTGDPDTSGILLTNGSTGAIAMLDGATEIVRVNYGTFGFSETPPGGATIQVTTPTTQAEQESTSWCLSDTAWSGQPSTKIPKDTGTPGAASDCLP